MASETANSMMARRLMRWRRKASEAGRLGGAGGLEEPEGRRSRRAGGAGRPEEPEGWRSRKAGGAGGAAISGGAGGTRTRGTGRQESGMEAGRRSPRGISSEFTYVIHNLGSDILCATPCQGGDLR